MIAIALKDRTVEVASFNTAHDEDKGLFSLWGTAKVTGKNFKIFESADEQEIVLRMTALNKAIELGEYLFDMKVGE